MPGASERIVWISESRTEKYNKKQNRKARQKLSLIKNKAVVLFPFHRKYYENWNSSLEKNHKGLYNKRKL